MIGPARLLPEERAALAALVAWREARRREDAERTGINCHALTFARAMCGRVEAERTLYTLAHGLDPARYQERRPARRPRTRRSA